MGQQREVRQMAREYEQRHGRRREGNVQVQSMPKLGEIVMILENHTLHRSVYSKSGKHVTAVYIPAESYLDVNGDPEIYTVTGYTKGIENPLDEDNWIELYHSYKGGGGFTTRIKARLVAIGYYKFCRLDKVNNDIHEELKRRVIISECLEDTIGKSDT